MEAATPNADPTKGPITSQGTTLASPRAHRTPKQGTRSNQEVIHSNQGGTLNSHAGQDTVTKVASLTKVATLLEDIQLEATQGATRQEAIQTDTQLVEAMVEAMVVVMEGAT